MVWAWVIVGVVFGGVFYGLGWGSARLKDFWRNFVRTPVVLLDRNKKDLAVEWVKPTKAGELEPEALEGAPIVAQPESNWTWNGKGRTFIVDTDTDMCFRVAEGGGAEDAPGLAPPDTSKTLVERADGTAEMNFRRDPPEGLAALIAENGGIVVVLLFMCLLVIMSMVAAILLGGG